MDSLDVRSASLEDALGGARSRYAARSQASQAAFERAAAVMPGGNTRSVLYYEPFPLAIARGEGAWLWDADGHRYLDLLGEYTAGLYGHSNPVIREALVAALDGGLNLGGHNLLEPRLAELICERFASIDQVRFTNSGTEANLMAIAAAKVWTGRDQIIVFKGGYHGGVLSFGGQAHANVPHGYLMAEYNDAEGVRRLVAANAGRIAAVLVEPMLGAGGCIPGEPAFLAAIREATAEVGAAMVLDEVMTSRMSAGGQQALLGLMPDLTTLGKYIGGGSSFGAFGGRHDIMALFDPREPGAISHPGTFNNNVLTMAAGAAGLTYLFPPDAADAFRQRGDQLRARLNAMCEAEGVQMQFTGLGSVMNVHFTAKPIRCPADAAERKALQDLFFFDMAEAGFYVARRGMIALMLPITPAELETVADAVGAFVERRHDLMAA